MDSGLRPLKASYGGRGPKLVLLSWVFFTIGVVAVILRVYTTLFIVRRPRWDLYFTLMATALAITAQPFIVLASYKGVGNAVQNVAPPDLADMLYWQWWYYIFCITSTIFSKLAVASIILQIQGKTFQVMRYILYGVMTVTVILGFLIAGAIFAQCSPVSDLWLTDPNTNPNCKGVDLVLVGGTIQGSFSAFGDFFLAIYPAIIFWKLQMSWRRRLGICVLFLGGVVSAIGAILKTVYVLGLKTSTNPTGATADLMTWAHVEIWLLITFGTLPPLRPLFVKVFKVVSTHMSDLSYGRKSRQTNSSAGFYELSKGSVSKRMSRQMDIECAGNANAAPGNKHVRGETWMEPTSSEEDMLASTREQSQVQSVVIDHGAAEEQRDVVAALGSAPVGTPRPLPGHVIAQARPVH
ncbi:hypothetical protein B9Z65_2098 [Elsinoe australis]|uniref:Rhodopsin domain-containing protein n=1 Tax=Elsinoe australis TaxID=40998 RepID=A0A2P7YN14_9PEZI|nr:hypothetical protein B9Z65_2098 [Elsinoe australis]